MRSPLHDALPRNLPGGAREIGMTFLSQTVCVKAEIQAGNFPNKSFEPYRYIFLLGKSLLKHL
jgi:hypothetical protein